MNVTAELFLPPADSPGRKGVRLTDAQRLDWLRLIRSENVGPRTFRALLNRFGGARAALDALPELARRGGGSSHPRLLSAADAEKELNATRRAGIALVALGEPEYPARLQTIPDPPPLLAVRGNVEATHRPAVALVGSRNASAAGLKFAAQLAHGLNARGFVTVSGLARGIDAAAHRASLGGGTIAVLAGGHDKIYPPEHASLLAEIMSAGAAVSEMPLGWEPRARDFPRRNRIISGLSAGVVVVEAAQRSGSLITARLALEQGREVFAVPGSPLDPRAEGTNGLIKEGAAVVTTVEDIVGALGPILDRPLSFSLEEPVDLPSGSARDPGGNQRAAILGLLGPVPTGLDDLVRMSGATPGVVRMVLLELEIAGRLERHGNGLVSLAS